MSIFWIIIAIFFCYIIPFLWCMIGVVRYSKECDQFDMEGTMFIGILLLIGVLPIVNFIYLLSVFVIYLIINRK